MVVSLYFKFWGINFLINKACILRLRVLTSKFPIFESLWGNAAFLELTELTECLPNTHWALDSHTLFFWGSLIEPVGKTIWPVTCWDSAVLPAPFSWCWDNRNSHHTGCSVSVGDMTSGPHPCTAKDLATESFTLLRLLEKKLLTGFGAIREFFYRYRLAANIQAQKHSLHTRL